MERDALRYLYLAGEVTGIAVSYHNLGGYLRRHARQPAPALASHLAAALIRALAGIGGTGTASAAGSARQAAWDLAESGTAATLPDFLPADVADLCDRLGDIPGTDLRRLLAVLSADPGTIEQTLRELIAQAQELAASPSES